MYEGEDVDPVRQNWLEDTRGRDGASLENTLAPSTPSRSSIDWKGLPGDGEDEVGRGEMEKERKDCARFLTTTGVSNTTYMY